MCACESHVKTVAFAVRWWSVPNPPSMDIAEIVPPIAGGASGDGAHDDVNDLQERCASSIEALGASITIALSVSTAARSFNRPACRCGPGQSSPSPGRNWRRCRSRRCDRPGRRGLTLSSDAVARPRSAVSMTMLGFPDEICARLTVCLTYGSRPTLGQSEPCSRIHFTPVQ